MSGREQNVVILVGDTVSIVTLPDGEKHSHQIGIAPAGFRPGDEQFIKVIRDQAKMPHLLFDYQGKWAAEADKESKSGSILERMKKGYLS